MPVHAQVVARSVYVTTSFVAYHRWPNAPESTAFLRDYHRHKFNVMVSVMVTRADREVEFFALKKDLEEMTDVLKDGRSENSCEMFADLIAGHLVEKGYYVSMVSVNEDDENGTVTLYNSRPA